MSHRGISRASSTRTTWPDMPFRSRAQERWAHTPAGEEALGGPAKVAEWSNASKGMKLPERAKPTRKVNVSGNTTSPSTRKDH